MALRFVTRGKAGHLYATSVVKHIGDRAYRAGLRPHKFTVRRPDGRQAQYELRRCDRLAGRNGECSRPSMTLVREGEQLDWAILDGSHRVNLVPQAAVEGTTAFFEERALVEAHIDPMAQQNMQRDREVAFARSVAYSRGEID